MAETETSGRRPACDQCRVRKTKCDRQVPCSSCVTLNVECRPANKVLEKRQRVLLSTKYDEAVQDINLQLREMKSTLHDLTQAVQSSGSSGTENPQPAPKDKTPMLDDRLPELGDMQDGYKGESSFHAHARHLGTALETDRHASHLNESHSVSTVYALLQDTDPIGNTRENEPRTVKSPISNCHAQRSPLPPMESALKLLRLAQVEKQRFLVDVPLFEPAELNKLCNSVYLAMTPYSVWTWISVNVGLYYLFLSLNEPGRQQLGVSTDNVASYVRLLASNIDAATQELKICHEPSLDSCRALAVLATFYVKSGQSAIAWRTICYAARACLDLGLHRLPSEATDRDVDRHRVLFWYIYAWDQALAFSGGKTPTIHQYDATSDRPFRLETSDIHDRLYTAYLEAAAVTGQIHLQLFSASSLRLPQHIRTERAIQLAAELTSIKESVQRVANPVPLSLYLLTCDFKAYSQVLTWDPLLGPEVAMLDVLLQSLLVVTYRTLPSETLDSSPLQCCVKCVDASRLALKKLISAGEEMTRISPLAWIILLNVILSFVPCVSVIVLVGNAIATNSDTDLDLIESAISVMAPSAAESPIVRKTHGVCDRFHHLARQIIASEQHRQGHKHFRTDLVPATAMNGHDFGMTSTQNLTFQEPVVDDHIPMTQQDWNDVMETVPMDFGDLETQAIVDFAEPYLSSRL